MGSTDLNIQGSREDTIYFWYWYSRTTTSNNLLLQTNSTDAATVRSDQTFNVHKHLGMVLMLVILKLHIQVKMRYGAVVVVQQVKL